MKKYQLFDEHCNREIFGENLGDAIMHTTPLPTKGSFDGQKYTPGPAMHIANIIGKEDTTASTRGNYIYERAIVATADGKYIAVDAREIAEIPPAG